MRYKPDYIPNDADARTLVEYLNRELNKISETVDHNEATTINFGKEVYNTVTSNAVTINWKRGQHQRLLVSDDVTVTFIPPEGVCIVTLVLKHDTTWNITLPCTIHWEGGTEPSWTGNDGVDVIYMYYDGSAYHAFALFNTSTSCGD